MTDTIARVDDTTNIFRLYAKNWFLERYYNRAKHGKRANKYMRQICDESYTRTNTCNRQFLFAT